MNPASAKHKNILLLSGGSKVAIARITKEAAKRRGATLHISDTNTNVPTHQVADTFTVLPPHTDPSWEDELVAFCRKAEIGLIIPTRHSELQALEKATTALESLGTSVSISNSKTLKTCIHKTDTFSFLESNNIPTPKTFTPQTLPQTVRYPLIAKPSSGSSSVGILEIKDKSETKSVPDTWILQEKAPGIEFTTNLYLNKQGDPICAIPHQRIAVEAGEVVQARTRRIPKLAELCVKTATALPGAQGIINIQAFYCEKLKTVQIIEINPRIGGGYPLCDAAKGHYIEWLCQEHLDGKTLAPFDAWTENLLMMRYREALFSL